MHLLECHIRVFMSQHLLDYLHRDFLRAKESREAMAQIVPPEPYTFVGFDDARSDSV